MQPRKRKLHLRLHADRAHHTAPHRVLGHVLQQRRLAHARLTTHYKRPALTCTHSIDKPIEHVRTRGDGP